MLHDHTDKIESVTLVPSSGGVHEVTFGDTLLHSKKESGKHPDPDAILAQITG